MSNLVEGIANYSDLKMMPIQMLRIPTMLGWRMSPILIVKIAMMTDC